MILRDLLEICLFDESHFDLNFESFMNIFKKKSFVMPIFMKLFHVSFILSQIMSTPLVIFIIS